MGALPVMIDPPSGWKFGFPKLWEPVKNPDFKQWLIDSGYPEEDVWLAMKWSRSWAPSEEDE